ncbi:MAG TPA: hypothetical protein VFD73_23740 [Gemmatimonadales bacterium]|nr:hypothetical protein [Gemmatimonadales bacterium]
MRKILVAAAALAIAAGVPAVALAATGGNTSALDLQASKWTSTTQQATGTTWRSVPGLGLTICALHQVTATLSVQVNGAPASFQIREDGGPIIAPGAVRFVPAGAHDSFSLSFLANAALFEANYTHGFEVEWR